MTMEFKVHVSVNGRFHLFDLAQKLHERGYLHGLTTSYPKFFAKRWGIPPRICRSILLIELLKRSSQFLPEVLRRLVEDYHRVFFDLLQFTMYYTRLWNADFDIFVGLSSHQLKTVRYLQKRGKVIVIDDGSPHPTVINELCHSEKLEHGFFVEGVSNSIEERKKAEYLIANSISVPSMFVRDTFLAQGVSEHKLFINQYGADLKKFLNKKEEKKDKKIRFIFCGAVGYRKGVHFLIKTFKKLKSDNVELWIVGNIDRKFKKEFLEDITDKRIILFGHRKQDELAELYNKCDVFVICSVHEGLAMVQLQALACGLPVLGTENTGAADIITNGENGYILKHRSEKELLFYMKNLTETPDLLERLKNSAELSARTKFSWENYGKRMIKNYQKLINERC